tara:strand:- start:572 stop:910 length:339 start_codon:yes stop_codon:yes gene_type:complete
MQQLELLPYNIDKALVKEIKHWRLILRSDEKNIFKAERKKRQFQSELSLLKIKSKNNEIIELLSLYRQIKILSKMIELQKELVGVWYESYIESYRGLLIAYRKLNSRLRIIK